MPKPMAKEKAMAKAKLRHMPHRQMEFQSNQENVVITTTTANVHAKTHLKDANGGMNELSAPTPSRNPKEIPKEIQIPKENRIPKVEVEAEEEEDQNLRVMIEEMRIDDPALPENHPLNLEEAPHPLASPIA